MDSYIFYALEHYVVYMHSIQPQSRYMKWKQKHRLIKANWNHSFLSTSNWIHLMVIRNFQIYTHHTYDVYAHVYTINNNLLSECCDAVYVVWIERACMNGFSIAKFENRRTLMCHLSKETMANQSNQEQFQDFITPSHIVMLVRSAYHWVNSAVSMLLLFIHSGQTESFPFLPLEIELKLRCEVYTKCAIKYGWFGYLQIVPASWTVVNVSILIFAFHTVVCFLSFFFFFFLFCSPVAYKIESNAWCAKVLPSTNWTIVNFNAMQLRRAYECVAAFSVAHICQA